MNAKAAFAVAKKLAAVVLTSAIGLSSAHAFLLDTKIGSSNLPDSGNDTELTAIEEASGN